MQLPVQQLEYLKNQVEEEYRMLTDSMSKLKVVQQKFSDSMENIEKLKKIENGTSVLIPMSSSMYVPGEIASVTKVTVEIGAGYYAEKSISEANSYLQRKKEFLVVQIDKIQQLVGEKQSFIQAMAEAINSKVQQQMHSSNVAEQMASMKT